MEFNPDNIEVMHFGSTKDARTHTMNNRVSGNIHEKRDLGGCPEILKVALQMVDG